MGSTNPWLALSTYEEKHEKVFFGREEDIKELFSMLQQNDFTICYAASGEGKSSLINAGLCPKLRRNDMFPIRIVFTSEDYKKNDINFDEEIGKKIEGEFRKYEKVIDEIIQKHEITRNGNYKFVKLSEFEKTGLPDNLWLKLRTQKIRNPFNGDLLTPVLIFDQFEEYFRASWKAKFFQWLEKMANDVCPDEIAQSLEAETIILPSRKLFKMLFSMRYEYVGELDYWCSQKYFIPQMMRNRYFLKPLTTIQAYSIIDEQERNDASNQEQVEEKKDGLGKRPSERLKEHKERIVESIKKSSKNKDASSTISEDNDEIPAIILSLVCYVLYNKWENNSSFVLSDQDLDKIINTGIYDYYDEQLNALDVPEEVRIRLESVLTNSNNERVRVALSDDRLQEIKINKYITDEKNAKGNSSPNLISTHVLKKETIDGIDYIEFIHDRLVLAIAEYNEEKKRLEDERIKREEVEQQLRKEQRIARNRKISIRVLGGSLLFILLFILLGWLLKCYVERPVEYHYETIKTGDTIPRYSKFYSVPNGKLVLKNCTVLPYTFIDNKEIRCVVLDSAIVKSNALFCPKDSTLIVDTLIIKSKQFSFSDQSWFYDFKHSKTIIVEKPTFFFRFPITVNSINNILTLPEDSAYFKKHRGTLFALKEPDSANSHCIWYPIFKDSFTIMIDDGFFGNDSVAVKNIKTIYDFNLGNDNSSILQKLSDSTNNIRLRLICNDKKKDTLHKNDIPIDIRQAFIEADLSNIKVVENDALSNCKNLDSLYLNEAIVIGDSAFYNCYNLKALSLNEANRIGDYAFSNCENLLSLSALKATHIGNYAFQDCNKLEKLNLPQTKFIGKNAFQNAWSMSELSLPEAIHIGDNAFQNCNKLEKLNLPQTKFIGKNAFQNARSMSELSLPEAIHIGDNAFNNCDKLKSLSIPNIDTINYGAFSGCDSLNSLSLTKTTYFGKNAFSYCHSLAELSIPKASFIGDYAFRDCDSMKSLVAHCVKYIGQYAFAYCNSLRDVVLDSVIEIHNNAFRNDTLYRLTIPQIEFIGNSVFNVSNESVDLVWNKQATVERGNDLLNNRKENALNNAMSLISKPNTRLDTILNRLQEIGIMDKSPFTNDKACNYDSNNAEYEIVQNEAGSGCFAVSLSYKDTQGHFQTDLHYYLYFDTISHVIIDNKNREVLHFHYNYTIPIVDSFDIRLSRYLYRSLDSSYYGYYRYYHGDFYSVIYKGKKLLHRCLLLRSNREEYVSLHPIITPVNKILHVLHGNKCKRFVSLYLTNEIDSFEEEEAKNITLIVPYGQFVFYQSLYGTKFASVEQMSWYKTLVYRIKYSESIWQTNDKVWQIRNKNIRKSSVQWDDILVFICCVLLLPIPLLLNRFRIRPLSKIWCFKRNRRKIVYFILEVLVLAVIFGSCAIFHFVRNGYGSMWPTWKYALPIWLLYLVITTCFIINRKKKESKTNSETVESV